jgi:hypothetical protein
LVEDYIVVPEGSVVDLLDFDVDLLGVDLPGSQIEVALLFLCGSAEIGFVDGVLC